MVMQSKPTFYRQETSYSCVPACLRTVLSVFGITPTEEELRELCDCTIFGTEALKAVDAARHLGLHNTTKSKLSIGELSEQVNSGNYPIVFVDLLHIDRIRNKHAIVVLAVEETEIFIYDPSQGSRRIERSAFELAWRVMSNISILLQA